MRVGQRLVGISDPVRQDEVWQLQDRPSLRYVRDVLRMRAPASITLLLCDAPELALLLRASGVRYYDDAPASRK